MTASPPSPELIQAAHPVDKRSRKVYILWTVALSTLVALGLMCWLVVVPYVQARRAVVHCVSHPGDLSGHGVSTHHATVSFQSLQNGVGRLGGEEAAVRKLSVYLRFPHRLTPHRPIGALMLGVCGKRAGPELMRLLRHDDNWVVRWRAADALAEIRDPRASEALAAALEDKKELVRWFAAIALGRLGDGRAVAVLVDLLETDDESCPSHLHAVEALREIGGPARKALERAARNKDGFVRQAATEALKKIKAAQEKR